MTHTFSPLTVKLVEFNTFKQYLFVCAVDLIFLQNWFIQQLKRYVLNLSGPVPLPQSVYPGGHLPKYSNLRSARKFCLTCCSLKILCRALSARCSFEWVSGRASVSKPNSFTASFTAMSVDGMAGLRSE